MNPGIDGDRLERERLLGLVTFARRSPQRPAITGRHVILVALAALSLFAVLRSWTTWRSFKREVVVRAEAGIEAAERRAMIAAIQADVPGILDPVGMDAATVQRVFWGLGRIERTVSFVREGRGIRGTVSRCNGDRRSARRPEVWHFRFDGTGSLKESSRATMLIH